MTSFVKMARTKLTARKGVRYDRLGVTNERCPQPNEEEKQCWFKDINENSKEIEIDDDPNQTLNDIASQDPKEARRTRKNYEIPFGK